MAEKLFKEEMAIGQTVIYEKKLDFKVTGVYEDLPKNSTVRPAYILSLTTLKGTENIVRDESWAGNFMTYVLLTPEINAANAEAKIKNVYSEFKDRELEELVVTISRNVFHIWFWPSVNPISSAFLLCPLPRPFEMATRRQ